MIDIFFNTLYLRIISFLSTIADVEQILKETVLFSFVMHSNDAETID